MKLKDSGLPDVDSKAKAAAVDKIYTLLGVMGLLSSVIGFGIAWATWSQGSTEAYAAKVQPMPLCA